MHLQRVVDAHANEENGEAPVKGRCEAFTMDQTRFLWFFTFQAVDPMSRGFSSGDSRSPIEAPGQ